MVSSHFAIRINELDIKKLNFSGCLLVQKSPQAIIHKRYLAICPEAVIFTKLATFTIKSHQGSNSKTLANPPPTKE